VEQSPPGVGRSSPSGGRSSPGDGVLGRILESIPPAPGAEVMGTGIVSIAFSLDGQETLSRVLLVIAGVIWVALAVLISLRAVRDPARLPVEAHAPRALTTAVSTAVLGTRLTLLGWAWAGIAALVIAFVLSALLLGPILARWKSPTVGASLLLAVAPQSLAVLAATLALPEHARWLVIAALVLFALGLGCYVVVIARFDLRQLIVGHGDHWITGGALGISSLAAVKIAVGAEALAVLGGGVGALEDIAIGLWGLTILWLMALLFAEARWPRLRYDWGRWSTVFPLGMYAASSFAIGALAGVGAITSFARVWVWIALAVWAIVFVGTLLHGLETLRRDAAPDPAALDGRAPGGHTTA
jgi:tellurite resistance protein TehA-like permease